MKAQKQFSVIIPVLHEAPRINLMLNKLSEHISSERAEIIIVDGDSNRSTLNALERYGIIGITSPSGRGIQMNAGAKIAGGDVLLFLHADTELPAGGLNSIEQALSNPEIVGGAFDLKIKSPRRIFRLIETLASQRSRLTRIPYGDQAIFLRRRFFEQIGGFAEIPIMEDVELMQRIKRRKGKIKLLPKSVNTSARRWENEGVLHTTVRNWRLLLLYMAGVSPQRLASAYRPCPDSVNKQNEGLK